LSQSHKYGKIIKLKFITKLRVGKNYEKTIENLTKAFIGESQARNRYTFYSKIAKKEGFEQIARFFLLQQKTKKNMQAGCLG